MSNAYFKAKSWGAYKSTLAELVRTGHPDKAGKKRSRLSDLEKRVIYAWIDYNIPYYPTSFTNHPKLLHGMRELVPRNFEQTLADVATRRCISCHTKPLKSVGGWFSWNRVKGDGANARKLPLKFYLRWEKPELNNFMLAPLAKDAGGTGRCGKAIYNDKSDPDYQKLLKAFTPIHELVKKSPRMDMPNAKEIRTRKHSALYEGQDKP